MRKISAAIAVKVASMAAALSTAALILVLGFAVPAQAGEPMETVKTAVNKVLSILTDPAYEDSKDEQARDVREVVQRFFGMRQLSMRTLGRAWRDFSDAQQEEFVTLYAELLENTYMDRILEYSDEKVVFTEEIELSSRKAEVRTMVLTGDGKEIPISYRLFEESGGGWLVYDVQVEGVSLVQNYRSQFRDLLAGGSPKELIQVLRDKVKGS